VEHQELLKQFKHIRRCVALVAIRAVWAAVELWSTMQEILEECRQQWSCGAPCRLLEESGQQWSYGVPGAIRSIWEAVEPQEL